MQTEIIIGEKSGKNANKLFIPEPKILWELNPKEKKRLIIDTKMVWAIFRSQFGFQVPENLSELEFGSMPNSNQKLMKNEDILIFSLALAQSNLSGINVCCWSSPECRANCVGKNGNNGFPKTMQAKIAKTRFLFEFPDEAGILLAHFWERAETKGQHLGKEIGGRLNTFSDINWIKTAPWIFSRFENINFYDYTKDWNREAIYKDGSIVKNYHLTYSASERTTDDEIVSFLEQGKNVAVIFYDWRNLPSDYLGYQVVDGDKDDIRWKDPVGVIVGLKRKGSMKATSPMVRKF